MSKLIEHAEICNIEVAGANDRFTTFTPTRLNTAHTIAMVDLYRKMKQESSWIDSVIALALPHEEYLTAIENAIKLNEKSVNLP